jgi:hypothetical protein
MHFAPEGIPIIVSALALAIAAYVVALVRRSWPIWLVAFALTLGTLGIAYRYRASQDTEKPMRHVAGSTESAELPR